MERTWTGLAKEIKDSNGLTPKQVLKQLRYWQCFGELRDYYERLFNNPHWKRNVR